MKKNTSYIHLGMRRSSQQYNSEKRSPQKVYQKTQIIKTKADQSVSPMKQSLDLRKPLELINNSPLKPDMIPNHQFTFENRDEKQSKSQESVLRMLRDCQELNEQLRKDNEKLKKNDYQQKYLIEILKKQREQDKETIERQKQQLEELEIQIQNYQESEPQMKQPIESNFCKLKELETNQQQYLIELSNMTMYLKEVLEQNKMLQTAYDDKCGELDQIKQQLKKKIQTQIKK